MFHPRSRGNSDFWLLVVVVLVLLVAGAARGEVREDGVSVRTPTVCRGAAGQWALVRHLKAPGREAGAILADAIQRGWCASAYPRSLPLPFVLVQHIQTVTERETGRFFYVWEVRPPHSDVGNFFTFANAREHRDLLRLLRQFERGI